MRGGPGAYSYGGSRWQGPYNWGAKGGGRFGGGRNAQPQYSRRYENNEEEEHASRRQGPQKHPAVQYKDAFVAREIRPYPGEDGASFFKRRSSRSDAETLSLHRIGEGMTHMNNEWFNGRFAHAMSFLCQNIREADDILHRIEPQETAGLKAVGLYNLASFFKSKEGDAFKRAARLLNFYVEVDREEDDLSEGVKVIFKHLRKLEKDMRRAAVMSAKLLAFSMQGLEALAALETRDAWADALHSQSSLHNDDVMKFVRAPKDDEALLDAIVSTYTDYFATKDSGLFVSVFEDGDDEKGRDSRRRAMSSRGDKPQKRKASRDRDLLPGSRQLFGESAKKVDNRRKRAAPALFGSNDECDHGDNRRGREKKLKKPLQTARGSRKQADDASMAEGGSSDDECSASAGESDESAGDESSVSLDDVKLKAVKMTEAEGKALITAWTSRAASNVETTATEWLDRVRKQRRVTRGEILNCLETVPDNIRSKTKLGSLYSSMSVKSRLGSDEKKEAIGVIIGETQKLLSYAPTAAVATPVGNTQEIVSAADVPDGEVAVEGTAGAHKTAEADVAMPAAANTPESGFVAKKRQERKHSKTVAAGITAARN